MKKAVGTGRVTTVLEAEKEYWLLSDDYEFMPRMSLLRVHGDPDDEDAWTGELGDQVYVVLEGRDGEWAAAGYVNRRDLVGTEELVAAVEAYRFASTKGDKVPVSTLSDGMVEACDVLKSISRPQMTVASHRDMAPEDMMLDADELRIEFRDVCRGLASPDRPLCSAFADGATFYSGDDFEQFKAELAAAFGIPMEIDQWVAR